MIRNHLYRSLRSAFIFAIVAIMTACGENNPFNPEPPMPDPGAEGHKVIVLDRTERSSVQEIKSDGTVIFNGTSMAEKLSAGMIICSEPTENAPYGFLYRVESVKVEGGATVVNTQTVELAEAVGDGHGEKTFSLADHVKSVIGPDGKEIEFTQTRSEFEGGIEIPVELFYKPGNHVSISLRGSIALKANIHFDVDFKAFSLNYLEFWFEPEFKADLSAQVECSIESRDDIPISGADIEVWPLEVCTIEGAPVVIQVGVLPLVVTPVYRIHVKTSLAGKVTLSAKLLELDYKYRSGVRKDTSGYHLISEDSSKKPHFFDFGDFSSGETYSLKMEGALKVAPTVEIFPAFYNLKVDNFSISLGIPFKAKVSGMNLLDSDETISPYVNPNLKLTTGLDATFHFDLEPLISEKHFKFEPEVTFIEATIYNGHFFPAMSNMELVQENENSAVLRYGLTEFDSVFNSLSDYGLYLLEGEHLVMGNVPARQFSLGSFNLSALHHNWEEYPVNITVDNLKPNTRYTAIPFIKTITLIPFLNIPHYGYPFVFSVSGQPNPMRVATLQPTEVSSVSAMLRGSFEDGGTIIQEMGFCLSSQNEVPTIENGDMPVCVVTPGTSSFVANGLTPGTKYYVRAYATNDLGTVYGQVITFTTLPDGNGGVVVDIPGENL